MNRYWGTVDKDGEPDLGLNFTSGWTAKGKYWVQVQSGTDLNYYNLYVRPEPEEVKWAAAAAVDSNNTEILLVTITYDANEKDRGFFFDLTPKPPAGPGPSGPPPKKKKKKRKKIAH